MMWVIIKHIENKEGVKLPVIILNSDNEIWEFDTEERANQMKNIFETNSDSGYEYVIKKIQIYALVAQMNRVNHF